MNIGQALNKAEQALREQGIDNPRLDAEVIMAFCLGVERSVLFHEAGSELPERQVRRFDALIARRLDREPVAYITGRKEFWSLDFTVDRHVLIPRPETELLVEKVLECSGGMKDGPLTLLEVGTGSGAVAVAIAIERPRASLVAVDISPAALRIARLNARRHGVTDRVHFVCGNLCEPLTGKFDIVLSNPPYIAEEEFSHLADDVRIFEPEAALVSGKEGTEMHRSIIDSSAGCLTGGGRLFMEMGAGQHKRIGSMLKQDGRYDGIVFYRDLAGIVRVVSARRKGTADG